MKTLAFSILLLQSFAAIAGGTGSDAGNGGGLAEKNVLFAFSHLQSFIGLCLNTSLCRTDLGENKMLGEISDSLLTEAKTPLDFRSDQKSLDFFRIDGLIRVAKTGDHVGDPIYINQDLLYSKLPSGESVISVAIDVPLAVSILIHELGHHHGSHDHNALDRLGSKLQTALLNHEERSEFWNEKAALVVYQLNAVRHDSDKSKIASLDQLVLENNSELYNLSDRLINQLKCPDGKAPLGVRLYNVYGKRGTHFDKKTMILTKPFEGWFIETCKLGSEEEHGDFTLELSFKKTGLEQFEFLPEKTVAKVIGCKKNQDVCK